MTPRKIKELLENWSPGFSPLLYKAVLIGLLVSAFAVPLALVAVPYIEFFNGMAVQPKGKAQSLYGFPDNRTLLVDRLPPPGTLPMDHKPYDMQGTDEEAVQRAAETLVNPLKPTMDVLERGQKAFNSFCITCHGEQAEGDGAIVQLFGAPPSLHTDSARAFKDGRIFHVISRGQNTMPSYGDLLSVEERWAVVHYVRVLQRALSPKPEDFER